MKSADIYTKLSVRIINKTKNPGMNVGSGFLYITKEHAFVFTAAHVISNPEHAYEIECFCRRDEVKPEELERYRYQVAGSAFSLHPDYQVPEDQKLFSKNDVAGIRLEKRPWMEGLPAIQFTVPVAEQKICFSGYPVKKWDESIEFAEKCCHTEIQVTSCSEKRLQFAYPDNADWSSMGDVVEGFSGCGVYADVEACSVPLLVGILTCGQGKNLLHGSINALSFLAIKELCEKHSWPLPLYAAEGVTDGVPNLERIASSNESQLLRQLSEEVRQKIEEMRDSIREMKLEEALALYEEFTKTTAYQNSRESDKCYLLFIKAHCHLLMGELETAEALLEEGRSYAVPERYWHLVEKANILMNQMGLPDGAARLEQAAGLLEEAIGLGVKDATAKIFKRYIEAVKSPDTLDRKLAHVHELSTDAHMDLKGMQDLYNVGGALCAQAAQYEKAAEYYNTAYSFQGDGCFLIQSAQMYLAQAARKSPEHNLLLTAKASDNFVKYLENCGEALANAFYREMGGSFLDCAMALNRFGLIIKHIDGIIAQTQNPDAVQRMYLMKAVVQIELEESAYETLQHLDLPDQKALYLHMEFKSTMSQYTQMLEEASVCGADAQAGIELAQCAMERYYTMLEEIRQSIHAMVCKIEAFLSNQNGTLAQGINCSLFGDRINGLLVCKNGDAYKSAIEQYQILFPELTDEHEQNRLLLPEACGEPEKTELLLLKYVTRNRNPQRMRCMLNFYFRNQNYNGLIDFYEGLVEDRDGLGQFGRSQLVWAYLDYLTKPSCTAQKALKQFLKYKDEILSKNLCDILEMRLNHRCYHYYSKWMKDTDYWINETHHESEYRDAILVSVYNLETEAAEYYYNGYVRYCLPPMSREEQRKQCPGWMWPYFALTAPGEETGNARQIMNDNLEKILQTVRNRNLEAFDDWKLLRAMEEKTVIIDGSSLYYLSKHDLLQNVFRVADQVVVTYSTIGWYLENERYVHDPVIEKIFHWIQTEGRVALSEANLENQCEFREEFGSNGWFLKGNHCLAKERHIPVIGACHNHEGMLEKMQTHIIWAGDFIDSIAQS